MRLTYSRVSSYEKKYNLIDRNALNNLKKKNLTTFHEIIRLFSQYSHKTIDIRKRPPKKQSSVIFKLDNVGKKRRDCRNVKILIPILL